MFKVERFKVVSKAINGIKYSEGFNGADGAELKGASKQKTQRDSRQRAEVDISKYESKHKFPTAVNSDFVAQAFVVTVLM